MKLTATLLFFLTLAMTVMAQKTVAMLQTLNGDKTVPVKTMELNMVIGELTKAICNQRGYKAFTRVDVDQMMKEHGFQNSGMVADAQRKRLGEMTGASYICVSKLTKSNQDFYIEAYLIDVETGEISNPATQYGRLEGGTYANLFQLCQTLAQELIGYVGGSSSSVDQKSIPFGYVDLGLPSGTLWKKESETDHYSYNEARNIYGTTLPTKDQWRELISYCKWEWIDNGVWEPIDEDNDLIVMTDGECGCRISGSNGNSIYLKASGMIVKDKSDGSLECGGCGGVGGIQGYYFITSDEHFYFGADRNEDGLFHKGFNMFSLVNGFDECCLSEMSVIQVYNIDR